MKRRTLLLTGAGTAGALVLGWSALPARQRLVTVQPLPVQDSQVALNGWVKLGTDNTVTVVMCKSEMGQGVHTGLAMLLAEELDADWARVTVEASPIDTIYNNLAVAVDGLPFHPDDTGTLKSVSRWMVAKAMREVGVMMTGASSSIKDLWLPMREAGASARAMLVAAAAEQWQVPALECQVAAGVVRHPSGRSARFGDLAVLAAQQPLPHAVRLKDAVQFRLIGQSPTRIEAPAKLDGSARFGIDMLPDGLLYASVVMCPTLGGRAVRFDGTAAARLPGVTKVLAVAGLHGGTGGVAVIAAAPFQAIRALAAVTVDWDHGAAAALSSEAAYRQLAQALDAHDGSAYFSQGDVDAALKSAVKTISAEYRAPYLAHATMEPMNCTVQFKDGRATVWASTQVPDMARRAVADVLGIGTQQVDMRVQLIGGGFGRRLEVDFIAQAAAIARDAGGAPVQTLWSLGQDITHDFYRPACVARFTAGFDAAGRVLAWRNTAASQALLPQVLERHFGLPSVLTSLGPDKTSAEGAFDQPYEWPNARVAHVAVELPVPVGFWRSVGHSHHAFFKESFMDEAAAAAGQDPVAFRAALLRQHPRHLKVLLRAAELSNWGQPLPAAADGTPRARGVALHESFGSVVAQVAEVSVVAEVAPLTSVASVTKVAGAAGAPGAAGQKIRVHRVVCVIDCGLAINPNLIRQQMESGIVFGLSAALHGDITLQRGQVQQSSHHDYPMLRMDDCPVIETDIIASLAHPEGVGETGTPPIAPAVANAVFALTGQRLRALPLRLV